MTKRKNNRIKRGNNEGSIFQRKNGQWVGAVTTGYNKDGVQQKKTVYGSSRREVEQKLSVYTNRIRTNSFEKLENQTADELMWEWLTVFKKHTITASTYILNVALFKNHIRPLIKGLQIEEVDDYAIQQVLNKMIDEDYSLSTIKKAKFMFNQFLDYAVESGWIANNPSHKIRVSIKNKRRYDSQKKYKAIPPEQRQIFLDALNKDPRRYLKPLCYTLMFAGLRIGEALGLVWKNIDLKNKKIKVEQAANFVPILDKNEKVIGHKTELGSTKTVCSIREVPIPDILVEALYEWYDKQKLAGVNNRKDYTNPECFVFCEDDCSIRTYTSCRHCFDRFKRANKLKDLKICFHGLRHTFSNILFEARENPKVIQQLLGHRDVATTITVYNNVNSDYIRQTTDRLNDQFKVDNPKYIGNTEKEKEFEINNYSNSEQIENNNTQTIEISKDDNTKLDTANFDNYSNEELDEMIKKLERAKRRKERDFEM